MQKAADAHQAFVAVQALGKDGTLLNGEHVLAMSDARRRSLEALESAKDHEINMLRAALQTKQDEFEVERRKLHNAIVELRGNIRVMCRVRPMNERESDEGSNVVQAVTGNPEIELTHDGQQHIFRFDSVLSPTAVQEDVFKEVSEVVQSAVDGYKVCVFAYGQTGSGKTHTLLHPSQSLQLRGIVARAMEQILAKVAALRRQSWEYNVEVSVLEVYNETLRDLLAPDNKLEMKLDEKNKVEMLGLQWIKCSCVGDTEAAIAASETNRSYGETMMNDRSSRSHTIVGLRLAGHHVPSGSVLSGALYFADLAGSERLRKSGSTGERMREAQSINKSLSALGDVFHALSHHTPHVPFRNSKLTWLLQPCLSAHGKAVMLVTLNPSSTASHETLCSLRFGALVNSVELGRAKKQIGFAKSKNSRPSSPPADSSGIRPERSAPQLGFAADRKQQRDRNSVSSLDVSRLWR